MTHIFILVLISDLNIRQLLHISSICNNQKTYKRKTSNFEVVSTGHFSQNLSRDGRSSPCHRSFLWPMPVGHCVSGQTQNGFLYKWGRLSQRIRCMWFPQLRLLGKPYFLGLKLPWWEVKCVLALVKWNSGASECGCEI